MAINEQTQSDEEYARRLQQQEFGQLIPHFFGRHHNSSQDISAPLLNNETNNNNNTNNNNQNQNENQNENQLNANANPNPNPNPNDNNNQRRNNQQRNNNNQNQNQNNNGGIVRRNIMNGVREADTESPRILLVRVMIGMIELIATATILAIGWNENGGATCNTLKYWVMIYSARHVIVSPLRIYIYRQSRRRDDNNAQQVPHCKAVQILRWITIMTFLWFLVGQTFLFTGKICQNTAPTIWYYCLVVIVLVYVSLALPFLIVLAICICLPCVLILFRFFAEPEGADQAYIQKLPTRKVTEQEINGARNESNLNQNNNNNDNNDDNNQLLINEEKTDNNNDNSIDNKNPMNDSNDANNNNNNDNNSTEAPACAICMQDYSVGDVLRVLPCSHEFHTDCVDKWLPMKKICPLCRHDITKPLQPSNSSQNLNNNRNNNNNNNNSSLIAPNDNSVNNDNVV